MKISFSLMDESAAREIVRWRYEPPYDVYNLKDSTESIQYVIDPRNNFYAMRDESGALVGFCSFGEDAQVPGGDYGADALDIGMGIRPDLTGQGYGKSFSTDVLNFVQKTFQPTTFRVTIAAFNNRARRVWERNGFHQFQTFIHHDSNREFVVMIKDAMIKGERNSNVRPISTISG